MTFGTPTHRDTGAMFRAVVDGLPLLAWISGPDKLCTHFNKPWLDFTGRPLESELGDGWAEGVHALDVQRCLDTYIRAFDRRETFMIEYRLRRHDGEYRRVLDHGAPAFDIDGSFCGYIGAAFDVTELRSAEAERNTANDRLQLAMQSAKSVGWDWDLRTNQIKRFGDLSAGFGMSPDPSVGNIDDFRRWMHSDDRDRVWQELKDAMQRRLPCATEFRIVWPNGAIRWVSATGQFYYSSGGDPERMLGIGLDITERKASEESLRRKEIQLNEAQRLAGVGSWHWDQDTDTVAWSDELSRMSGCDPAVPAPNCTDLSHLYTRESWDRLSRASEESLKTGTPYEIDVEMNRSDGTLRWVRARGEVSRDAGGRIIGLRGTAQDITEHRLAEEALSNVNRRIFEVQESERARIARDLHDDFGQRLALLAIGLGQLKGLQPDFSAAALTCLQSLEKQTGEIIGDLQALSHELHPPRLLLLGVAAAMRGLCRELSAQKNLRIDFHSVNVPANVPPETSLCLFRILQEALHNAVRHSQVSQFEVQLCGSADALCLSVRDKGVGFDIEAVSRGAGLGLTSMKERLKLVGGDLVVESQPSRGTTISARVPIILQSDTPPRHA